MVRTLAFYFYKEAEPTLRKDISMRPEPAPHVKRVQVNGSESRGFPAKEKFDREG